MAGRRDPRAIAHRLNLTRDAADILHRDKIQRPPPDERVQIPQEGLAQRPVPGADPRLRVGGALPVLARRLRNIAAPSRR
jgi:hypothetical protein